MPDNGFEATDVVVGQNQGGLRHERRTTQIRQLRQLKDEFLSLAAHEIRTPITVIKAQAQLVERFQAQGALKKEILDRSLRLFVLESDRLARLCNDLLDIARIDNGTLDVARSGFEFIKLVRDVVRKINEANGGEQERIGLTVDCEEQLVIADVERTERVLYSLLSNALRYSPNGGIVSATISQRNGQAVFSVRDNGIGIPSDKIAEIFERYYQAHQTGLKGPSGLGIGLYVSQEIVKRMGGCMTVKSEGIGQGAEFSFTVPLVQDNFDK